MFKYTEHFVTLSPYRIEHYRHVNVWRCRMNASKQSPIVTSLLNFGIFVSTSREYQIEKIIQK